MRTPPEQPPSIPPCQCQSPPSQSTGTATGSRDSNHGTEASTGTGSSNRSSGERESPSTVANSARAEPLPSRWIWFARRSHPVQQPQQQQQHEESEKEQPTLFSGEVIDAKNTVGNAVPPIVRSRRTSTLFTHGNQRIANVDRSNDNTNTNTNNTNDNSDLSSQTSALTVSAETCRVVSVATDPLQQQQHQLHHQHQHRHQHPHYHPSYAQAIRYGNDSNENETATHLDVVWIVDGVPLAFTAESVAPPPVSVSLGSRYDSTVLAPTPATSAAAAVNAPTSAAGRGHTSRLSFKTVVLILVLAIGLLIAVLIVVLVFRKDKSRQDRPSDEGGGDLPTGSQRNFTLDSVLIEHINSVTLSGQQLGRSASSVNAATEDDEQPATSTVEDQALQWLLLDNDENDDSTVSGIGQDNPFQWRQRYALRTLWLATTTRGGSWTHDTGWDVSNSSSSSTSRDECTWYGVECSPFLIEGRMVNAVTALRLPRNNLLGHLSRDLGLLSHLVTVDLWNNRLSGSIPETIGARWTNLDAINLGINRFTQSLPSSIGHWSIVTNVTLYKNEFSGPIPSSIAQWSRLRSLVIRGNAMTGRIPDAIGASWTDLQFLRIQANDFSGTVPTELCRLSNLDMAADCQTDDLSCDCCDFCY